MAKTKEERLVQQRLCKRKKYLEIKNNPELYALEQEKQRAKYQRRKQEKKQKSITEKSPREQRQTRKAWKENSKKYRQRKKEQLTLVPSVVHVQAEGHSKETNKPIKDPICLFSKEDLQREERKIRYRELKKRVRLVSIIKKLQELTKNQRKTILELRSRIRKYQGELVNPRDNDYGQAKENQPGKQLRTHVRAIGKLRSRKDTKFRLLRQQVIDSIESFYNDDTVSTIAAGKKEYITRDKKRMQKRYLTAPLKVLHKKFLAETDIKVSYSFFTKRRPFWVLQPKPTNRDTCLCVQHTNIELIIKALHNASILREKNSNKVISRLCCEPRSNPCLLRQCSFCKDTVLDFKEFSNETNLSYFIWRKARKDIVTKDGQQKKQVLTIKQQVTTQPLLAIKELESQLKLFFRHVHNIEAQYTTMKNLKEHLDITEAIIHVDFSENYALKYAEEVQAFHFGGSRQQVSLHTSVIYTHDFSLGAIQPTSVCTISKCLRHDSAAIWAHLIPLIKQAIEINPFINSLHFLSDSPISQYRNKYVFYIITQIQLEFENILRITWNYTETGHGKGAPDGVGAVLKRTADKMVYFGRDVGDFNSFCDVLKENVRNVIIKTVDENEVNEKESLLPKNLKTFRGTLAVHQVLWNSLSKNLALRSVSCFLCDINERCVHGKHLGFYEIATQPNVRHDDDLENVMMLAATAPKRSEKNKTIKILSDVTFKNNESLRQFFNKPSTSKSEYLFKHLPKK